MINNSGALSVSAEINFPFQSCSINGAIIQGWGEVLVDTHLRSTWSILCMQGQENGHVQAGMKSYKTSGPIPSFPR